ncbi:MAG: hypothetical protein WD928_11085 [Gammaproteobacteria bacterium]
MRTMASDASGRPASVSACQCNALVLLMVLLLSSCSNTVVIPPESPREPVPVFLLDHGLHTSLVLPAPDGTMTRYAYGDWRYYAERKTGLGHAIAALSWPTESALGRRHLPGPATEAAVRVQVRVGIQEVSSLWVEASRVADLRGRLNSWFEQAPVLESPSVELGFVPYPHPYSLGHNSNTMIAHWLEDLGAEVSRKPLRAGWRIEGLAQSLPSW